MKPLKFCLLLSAILVFTSPLAAQTQNNSRFYVDVTGHALFPHAASINGPPGQVISWRNSTFSGVAPSVVYDTVVPMPGLNTGAGLTAAFGALVGRGFSTEVEWGYQRAGIGDPDENFLLSAGGTGGFGEFNGDIPLPSISSRIDGDIHIQSLMVNLYYRHPSWRISPYAGFGAGGLFYNTRVNTRLEIDLEGLLDDLPINESGLEIRNEERRFGFQLMTGLSFRLRQRVELRVGYRYRSGRTGPVNSDQVEGGVRFRF